MSSRTVPPPSLRGSPSSSARSWAGMRSAAAARSTTSSPGHDASSASPVSSPALAQFRTDDLPTVQVRIKAGRLPHVNAAVASVAIDVAQRRLGLLSRLTREIPEGSRGYREEFSFRVQRQESYLRGLFARVRVHRK